MTSDFVVGMELVADNAILKWRNLIGPTNSLVNFYKNFNYDVIYLEGKIRSSQ